MRTCFPDLVTGLQKLYLIRNGWDITSLQAYYFVLANRESLIKDDRIELLHRRNIQLIKKSWGVVVPEEN